MFTKLKETGVILATFAPSLALAEDGAGTAPTIPNIVDVSTLQQTFVGQASPWILGALGVAISLFCIFFGWRLFRKGSKTGSGG